LQPKVSHYSGALDQHIEEEEVEAGTGSSRQTICQRRIEMNNSEKLSTYNNSGSAWQVNITLVAMPFHKETLLSSKGKS